MRLTLAMFGRVREAREALAAGTVLPAAPVVPERRQPSAGAGQCAAAETARTLTRNPDELELKAEGDKRNDGDPDDGPAPARRAHGSNRPDRESLTEFADFGFSLDRCHPGEVIARIYRDLGLPPDPARWPQAWPAGVPAKAGAIAKASGPDSAPTLDRPPNHPAAPAQSPDPESPPLPPPEAGPASSDDPPMPSAQQPGPPEDSS